MRRRLIPHLVALVILARISEGAVTGQWDFDAGDLRATIGTALEFVDGPNGATSNGTSFGTTSDFKISAVGGRIAKVMRFPAMSSLRMGYVATHGAKPNGRGQRVNQYTVIMDILYPSASSGTFRSLFQTDNRGDGEFYVNPGNGIGISGDYAGNVTPDTWHRIAFAVDLSLLIPRVSKFVDGVKEAEQHLDTVRDGRWSLGPSFFLFNDQGGESQMGYINSLQVRDRTLSDAEIRLLGGPSADGVPTNDLPKHPFVEWKIPAPNTWMIPSNTIIQVNLTDGQHSLETNSIRLFLNDQNVIPVISKSGRETIVSYQPSSPIDKVTNTVVVMFQGGGELFTNTWWFITDKHKQKPSITGQWDFERADLAATIGLPLQYLDGLTGSSKDAVQFNTTTGFGIPNIDGKPARVVRFAGASTRDIGLIMPHGALPNGGEGATRVNEWTLIMDIMIPNAAGEKWLALLQTDSANTSNADLFATFSAGRGGIGTLGDYEGNGAIIAGKWHRIAFAVDAGFSLMTKYIDGVPFAIQALKDSSLNGRHSLAPTAILFADDDQESQVVYINSVQFRNYKMEDNEIAALGGPAAAGIAAKSHAAPAATAPR